MVSRRTVLFGGALALTGAGSGRASAQVQPIKIGVLEDMSGVFSDLGGNGTTIAARMAVEDFGGKVLGRPIEIVSGDHQNKPDLALSIARKWYDIEGVGLITGLTNSAVALGVQKLAADKNKINIVQNASTDVLIEQDCSPNAIIWNWTARTIVRLTVEMAMKTSGKTWYFIVSDYAGGRIMEDEATPLIKSAGGAVLGTSRPPVGEADFASHLLTAQASKAEVLGVVTFGQDFVNLLRQCVDFGIVRTMRPVAPFAFHSDLKAVGPQGIQGMPVAAPFYWDLNPETRAFSDRFRKLTGRPPDVGHAGTYNALIHYFKSLKAANTDQTADVLAAMRKMPINDMSTKDGFIRGDGMVVRQIYRFVGKTPAESKDPWDLLKFVDTVPKEAAFPEQKDPKCRLLKA
ncbi:ABC transporter substrate-binding protein [Xanthobacter flavus]